MTKFLVRAGVLLLCLLLGAALVKTSSYHSWDFDTFWLAGAAARHGLDPYDTAQLSQIAGRPLGMPFVYPPVTLPLFGALSLLPLAQASTLWLGFKVLLFVVLVEIWRRTFLSKAPWVALVAAAALGFNAAVIWDLKAGNVAVLEQVLLWGGLAAYARDRRVLFTCLVVAAAIFKLVPIVFLGLLLLPSERGRDWKLFLAAVAVLATVVFLPMWIGPEWTRRYLSNLPAERPWGDANPTALGLIDTLVGDHTTPLWAPPYQSLIPWGIYLIAVILMGLPLWRSALTSRSPERRILVAALFYTLVTPRLMAYSYLLAIPPVLALAAPLFVQYGGAWTVAGLLSAQAILIRPLGLKYRTPWTADLPLFVLIGFWMLLTAAAARSGAARPDYRKRTTRRVSTRPSAARRTK